MATPPSYSTAGGFIRPLPSPSPSTTSSSSSTAAFLPPQPRSRPLAPGSRKEDYARNFVSRRLLHISRRFVKHHGIPDAADPVSGYPDFAAAAADLDGVVDVLWVSATPGLQAPFLLDVAFKVTEYLPSFPPDPRATFALLRKLDHCLASLLRGCDVRTGAPLPGVGKRGLTKTDMVRLKSVVDQTRMCVAAKIDLEPYVETHALSEAARARQAHDGQRTIDGESRTAGSPAHGTKSPSPVVKTEYDSDSDDDDIASPPPSRTRKRKVGDEGNLPPSSPSPRQQPPQRAETPPKRLKTESPPVEFEIRSPGNFSNAEAPSTTGDALAEKGRFNFILDDDDDSDSDGPATSTQSQTQSVEAHIDASDSHPQQESEQHRRKDLTPPYTASESAEDRWATDGGYGRDEEEEEEDEDEMRMSVAKVYEKTIVELGRLLGETLETMVDW